MPLLKKLIVISVSLSLFACDYYAFDHYDDDVKNGTLKPGRINFAQIDSKARGTVNLEVYLPPSWGEDLSYGYPLIIYLHGQYGDEHSFFFNVNYRTLNKWIDEGDIPPFVLVSVDADASVGKNRQWSTDANETFLTSDDENELRWFCKTNFRTTLYPGMISIHGQSMGARGALHYCFKFPDRFASAVSDAFVSDYAIEEEQENAVENSAEIISSGIRLRLVIGAYDYFLLLLGRSASFDMHRYLEEINIPHEFEILRGATHYLFSIWNAVNICGIKNGLYELQFHSAAWEQRQACDDLSCRNITEI